MLLLLVLVVVASASSSPLNGRGTLPTLCCGESCIGTGAATRRRSSVHIGNHVNKLFDTHM